MSARNLVVFFLSLSILIFLAACGGNNGPGITRGTPPPSGAFNDGNLNGTYVFTASGTDLVNGTPYAVVGTINANGGGGITGGTIDVNDPAFSSPVIAAPINSGGSYNVGEDGRGTFSIGFTGNPFRQPLTFDFVLQNKFHGLVTEFDSNATGSGTLDLQTAGVTPSGSYAFSLAGATFSNGEPFATVGNFTLTGSTISGGLEDFNADGEVSTNSGAGWPLTGTVVAGPSSTTLSSLTATGSTFGSTSNGTLTFDVYPIDSTHLKFIEVDSFATLLGDAFTESTAVPTGSLAFTLAGDISSAPFAAGGIVVTDGSGNITSASGEDYNDDGTASSVPETFTGTYTGSAGRFVLTVAGFNPPTVTGFVAYTSDGGIFLLETDTGQITYGAAYAQTAGATFAASQGYGLNFSGINLGQQTGAEGEVDDIAEFTAAASGTSCNANGTEVSSDTLAGVTDENSDINGITVGQPLCGQYSGPDSTGRLGALYYANTSNGGVSLTAYTVDGTNFPFIETDNGQVSSGVFVLQNAKATSPSVAKAHSMFVPLPLVRPHAANQKKQTPK
jgi:hypothetical protein